MDTETDVVQTLIQFSQDLAPVDNVYFDFKEEEQNLINHKEHKEEDQ